MKRLILLAILSASVFTSMSFAQKCNTRPLENLDFKLVFLKNGKPIGRVNVKPRFVEVDKNEQAVYADVMRSSVPNSFIRNSDSFRFVSVQASPFKLESDVSISFLRPNQFLSRNTVTTPKNTKIRVTGRLLPSDQRRRLYTFSYSGFLTPNCK